MSSSEIKPSQTVNDELAWRLLFASGNRSSKEPMTKFETELSNEHRDLVPLYIEDSEHPEVVVLSAKFPKMYGQHVILPPYGTPNQRQRFPDIPSRVRSKLVDTASFFMGIAEDPERIALLMDEEARAVIDPDFSGAQWLRSGNGVKDHAHLIGYFSRNRSDPENLYGAPLPGIEQLTRESATKSALSLTANELDRLDDILQIRR